MANASEERVKELEAEIEAIKAKIEEAGGGESTEALRKNIETAKTEVEGAKEAAAEKEDRISDKEYLLSIYQKAFRVTTTMTPGENLGSFSLKNGETVEPCSFLSIGEGKMLVQMAAGTRSIAISDLPDAMASRFRMPPAVPQVGQSLVGVKAQKPEFLKPEAEKSASTASAKTGGEAAPGGNAAAAPPAGGDPMEAIRSRNAARMNQLTDLKEQHARLFAQKKSVRQERSTAEQGFRTAKIKRSQSEISSTLKMFDDKIKAIELQEVEVREKIARLQREME
ncbi:MAG TPA: hypothetical protein PLA50_17650 [Bacteroidia bacterium]|nr:hypothetical protein [Bacteroidia bacterium]